MDRILCWDINQAWKVKQTYDAEGHHVEIRAVYPFKDYPRRDQKKKAFICFIRPKEIIAPKHPLEFLKKLVGLPLTPQKKDGTNGQSKKKTR